MLLHVIWPLVDPLEIACDDLVNLHAIFKHFRLPSLILSFDSRYDWVVLLDSKNLVGNLVELLHFALSQQSAEFLYIFCLIKGTCNS
jgi:hypothetical protein